MTHDTPKYEDIMMPKYPSPIPPSTNTANNVPHEYTVNIKGLSDG